VRTALVIEDMENLSLLGEVKSQFVARLGEWSALKTRNENVMIFITNRDPLDENSERAMRDVGAEFAEISNLVNVALGKKGEANGFILYIPPPYEEEVERLLNEFRLKKRWEIKWGEYRNIVRWIAATNKRLKTLDGKFRAPLANNELSLASAKQNELIDGDPDPRSALDRLSEMIGRDEVKKQVARFVSLLKKRDGDSSQTTEFPNLHLAFTGNPGTGKTIVARLIGEIYRELGLLRRGHVVECRSDDLVAEHLGGTGPKTNAKINEALDGVLFVDEAYLLDKDEHGDFGKKAIGTIMARMENERHRISVVMAGYQSEMESLISSNVGLPSRFGRNRIFNFADYSPKELLDIFKLFIRKHGRHVNEDTETAMAGFFEFMYAMREEPEYFPPAKDGKSTYANARTVRELVESMVEEQAVRGTGDATELTLDDIPKEYRMFLRPAQQREDDLDRIIAELDSLVGLSSVKDFVQDLLVDHQLISQSIQVSNVPTTRHMLFLGNPGTGKTTVAQIIGRMFKHLNILSKGKFASVRREDLVAEYVGQTAPKTKRVVMDALDGVLFIDEAYSLAQDPHDSFGAECIATLLDLLESYRDRLVVIFAGYTKEMQRFVRVNSGIPSRIGYTVEFPDYSAAEMTEIFLRMAARDGFEVPPELAQELSSRMTALHAASRGRSGNARDVRVMFYEKMMTQYKRRLSRVMRSGGKPEDYPRRFEISDLPEI
jgi:SpoVK/Ycf46/Vps4 family AAA+-type ATPase